MLLSSQSSEIPPPRYKMTQMNLPHNTSTSTVAQAVSLYQPVTSHSSRIIFRSMVFMAAAQRGRGGGGYSHTLPTRVCAAQRGRDFEALRTGYPFQRRFLERGIIFRRHDSSSFVSSHLTLFKDRLLLKIRFNALTSKLLYSLHLRTEYKKLAHF